MIENALDALFAVLTMVAFAFVAVTIVIAVSARFSSTAAESFAWWRDMLDPVALQIALLLAAGALLGSLYYSEIADLTPCLLCWFQRIAIYPLTPILVVALIAGDRGVRKYVITLAAIGALISIWHILVQRVPALAGTTSCSLDAPCAVPLVQQFGFVTIPVMALAVTSSIVTLMLMMRAEPVSGAAAELTTTEP